MDSFGVPRPRRAVEEGGRLPDSGLPRRGRGGAGTGVRTAYFGCEPAQLAQIRSWCRQGSRLPAHRVFSLQLVASELVTNAWLHTASGAECGRVKVQLCHLLDRTLHLAVTDDGPKTGQPVCLPNLPPQADALAMCGRGLRLVEHLAVEWGWRGEPGTALTVWARIDPYVSVPDTVEA